jgi:hypothetical protein
VIAAVEGTIVSTSMPTIVGALGGFDSGTWVFSAYFWETCRTGAEQGYEPAVVFVRRGSTSMVLNQEYGVKS